MQNISKLDGHRLLLSAQLQFLKRWSWHILAELVSSNLRQLLVHQTKETGWTWWMITSPGNIRGKANTQAFSRLTVMFPGWRLILLMRMMPAYLDHIQRWPRSLIVRYAGARRGAYWSPIFGSFATTCLSKRMWYLMIFASFLSARFHLAYAPTTLGRITDLRLAYAEVTRKSYKL